MEKIGRSEWIFTASSSTAVWQCTENQKFWFRHVMFEMPDRIKKKKKATTKEMTETFKIWNYVILCVSVMHLIAVQHLESLPMINAQISSNSCHTNKTAMSILISLSIYLSIPVPSS